MAHYRLTLKSSNAKTGPIPVSTTSSDSCPTCPFKGNGCYAEQQPLLGRWREVDAGKYSYDLAELCRRVAALPEGTLWRHNQAGDLPGEGNAIDADGLAQLVAANDGKRGFTYTHKPMTAGNAAAVASANAAGFTINLSANGLAHADALSELSIGPVATVLLSTVHGNQKLATPAGRRVVVCPATYRDDVNCATCGLCAVRDRKVIVGFPGHGGGKAKVDRVVDAAVRAA